MKKNSPFKMQKDAARPNYVTSGGQSLHSALISPGYSDSIDWRNQSQVVAGFPLPSIGQTEAMNNNQACARINNPDEFQNLPGRDVIRNLCNSTSYPVDNGQMADQFMEAMPLHSASIATILSARGGVNDNLLKPTASGPSAYPSEFPRSTILSSDYDMVNSSFENSNYEYGGLPIDTGRQWDFNRFSTTPELVGRVIGRDGDQHFQPVTNSIPNGWVLSDNSSLNSGSPSSTRFSNELSLSLSTSRPPVACVSSIQDQGSEINCSGVANYCLHPKHLSSEQTSCNSSSLSLSFNSYKPIQLTQVLSSSGYLHVMQEILAEIARYSLQNFDEMSYFTTGNEDGKTFLFCSNSNMRRREFPMKSSGLVPDMGHCLMVQRNLSLQDGGDVEEKKKHLLALLQMVDDRYNQCLDEIHTVISAFHAVTELDPSIHARFALPAISFMYKNLRERIGACILAMGAHTNKDGPREEEGSFETSFIQKQWALQQLRKRDHQLWRPQRGLPERSVSVLRSWMFQNFLHPYPKDSEKQLLALKSGLTRSQVSNWFINARVRLWKPMIEEMYAEMNRRKNRQGDEETQSNSRNLQGIENRRFMMN